MSTTLDDIVRNLRALLVSSKGGVPFVQIDREYENAFGPIGSLSKLGFKSLYEILRNDPENFIFYGNCVLATVKSSSAHICNMVNEQRVEKRKRSNKHQNTLEISYEQKSHKKHLKSKYRESARHHPYETKEDPYKAFAPRCRSPTNSRHSHSRGSIYSDLSYRSLDIRRQKPEKSSTYNPNGWKFVSKALKQCGAIDVEKMKDRRNSEKKDFTDDKIDKHNYTSFE